MFAASSKRKYVVESDKRNPMSHQRSGSPSAGYVVIEKSGEQPDDIKQKEIESINDSHSISPTDSPVSMSSEAEATSTKASTKV